MKKTLVLAGMMSMNEIEQEILRRVLVELFLANPRKREQLHQHKDNTETSQKDYHDSKEKEKPFRKEDV